MEGLGEERRQTWMGNRHSLHPKPLFSFYLAFAKCEAASRQFPSFWLACLMSGSGLGTCVCTDVSLMIGVPDTKPSFPHRGFI